jgi:hypothetical protein
MDAKAKKNVILGCVAGAVFLLAAVVYFRSGSTQAVPGAAETAAELTKELQEQAPPPPDAPPPGGRRLKQ